MNEKRYYEHLSKIPESNTGTGFVLLDKVPYKNAGDAVRFLMRNFPEIEPKDQPIVKDSKRAAEIARGAVYILKELGNRLDRMQEEMDRQIETAKAELERLEALPKKDILVDVQIHTRRENLHGMCHEMIGLISAKQVVHDREVELWRLMDGGIPVEWRF